MPTSRRSLESCVGGGNKRVGIARRHHSEFRFFEKHKGFIPRHATTSFVRSVDQRRLEHKRRSRVLYESPPYLVTKLKLTYDVGLERDAVGDGTCA